VLVGVPADRQVAEELTGLAVGADEEALGLPPLPPGGFAEAGSIEIVTGLRETGSSPADRDSPVFEASFDPRQPRPEVLEAPALLVRLLPGLKAAALADGDREPPLDPVDTGGECPSLGDKVAPGELPGVLARASDRSGPARRARGGDRPLALSAGLRPLLGRELVLSAALSEVLAGERAEMTAHDP